MIFIESLRHKSVSSTPINCDNQQRGKEETLYILSFRLKHFTHIHMRI